MNAHQAASDWDYQDALHPQRAAYDAWCEAYLVEALKSDEIETAFSAQEHLESEFDALVLFLAFSAAEFRPLCLSEFRRQTFGMSRDQLQDALADGEIDPVEIVRLAAFAPDDARRTWAPHVRQAMDSFHDAVMKAAPTWGWVETIFEGRNEP